MNNNLILEDKELGRLVVRVHPRARRFVFRTRKDAIYITTPPGCTSVELTRVIEQMRAKLIASREQVSHSIIGPDYSINAPFFQFTLAPGERNMKFLVRFESNKTTLVYPPDTDFDSEVLQVWLRKAIEECMRRRAKQILPARLHALSEEHELPYNSVKINASKGRWGSCSSGKSINLSYYLILLPLHLIDYVLLHELTHTLEMSHNERFWSLLDGFTNKKALELRQELKKYNTTID